MIYAIIGKTLLSQNTSFIILFIVYYFSISFVSSIYNDKDSFLSFQEVVCTYIICSRSFIGKINFFLLFFNIKKMQAILTMI